MTKLGIAWLGGDLFLPLLWGSVSGSGAGAEDAAPERRRDPSGRVHSSAEEALTFEKRCSSASAIYPVIQHSQCSFCRAPRCAGLGRSRAGRAEAAVRGLPAERLHSCRWCRAKLNPPAGLGNISNTLQPLLAGGPEGLQHPRGDGGLVESTAGLPRQTLPLCTINSPPVSARTASLHWHPSSCRHNTSADTPTPQGTLSLVTPNALPAPDPKGHREVFL